jgi:hypothetical protein
MAQLPAVSDTELRQQRHEDRQHTHRILLAVVFAGKVLPAILLMDEVGADGERGRNVHNLVKI